MIAIVMCPYYGGDAKATSHIARTTNLLQTEIPTLMNSRNQGPSTVVMLSFTAEFCSIFLDNVARLTCREEKLNRLNGKGRVGGEAEGEGVSRGLAHR